jgi:hypothetical protein
VLPFHFYFYFFLLRNVKGWPSGYFAALHIAAPAVDGAFAFGAKELGSFARVHDDHAPPHDLL